jgi:nucleotide-binding universal stress UspA family protein
MHPIRRILVVVEPNADTDQVASLAIPRACLIARAIGASLHVLVCDNDADHGELLSDLRHVLEAKGIEVTTEQDWHESTHQAIVRAQRAQGADLVIKQHFPDSALRKALLTPADWKLLRYCPCPVLMVKSDKPWKDNAMLAAVDVGNPDGEHSALHYSIVQYGFSLSEMAGGELHVVAAHPSPTLSAAEPVYQLPSHVEGQYREQCKAFQTEFGIDDAHLHVAEGPADVLIPFTAHHLQAAVTVIGTVARTGFSGALIGNTAEVVLDSLESDVLVLKSEEIVAQLERHLAQI